MPKNEIDYSNTIIYKITCNDSTILDLYVGHTTNFVQRKHAHKQGCSNEKSTNYTCKLYEVIRNNGGWENWKMEIINFFNCKNHYEARKKEQEYFLSLNATLNSIEPYAIPKPKETVVKNIIIKEMVHNKPNYTTITTKHICEKCDYSSYKNSEYKKHLQTNKHINTTNYNTLISTPEKEYICDCGKKYNHRASLFNHKKKCLNISLINDPILDASSNEIKVLTNIVIELFKNNSELQKQTSKLHKQNQDFQKQMVDVCQKIQPTIINSNSNNSTNSNNKTFNLQFFLNEECKDAMNMSEFINSIQLKLSDIENIGKVGYVEGMSNIIIKKLNDTDMYKRPVHCTDAKRETLYVKEENKWEKEGPENSKMIKAVYGMNKKNYMMLNVWKDAHPNCLDGQTKQCDDYMKIMSKVMDGDKENINKVIKKVARQVLIDK
jgi:hypothetical protein